MRCITLENICLCRVRCPDCGGQSYVLDWQPERCPHCRTDLRAYTEYELGASDRLLTLQIDRVSGRVVEAALSSVRGR